MTALASPHHRSKVGMFRGKGRCDPREVGHLVSRRRHSSKPGDGSGKPASCTGEGSAEDGFGYDASDAS